MFAIVCLRLDVIAAAVGRMAARERHKRDDAGEIGPPLSSLTIEFLLHEARA